VCELVHARLCVCVRAMPQVGHIHGSLAGSVVASCACVYTCVSVRARACMRALLLMCALLVHACTSVACTSVRGCAHLRTPSV